MEQPGSGFSRDWVWHAGAAQHRHAPPPPLASLTSRSPRCIPSGCEQQKLGGHHCAALESNRLEAGVVLVSQDLQRAYEGRGLGAGRLHAGVSSPHHDFGEKMRLQVELLIT